MQSTVRPREARRVGDRDVVEHQSRDHATRGRTLERRGRSTAALRRIARAGETAERHWGRRRTDDPADAARLQLGPPSRSGRPCPSRRRSTAGGSKSGSTDLPRPSRPRRGSRPTPIPSTIASRDTAHVVRPTRRTPPCKTPYTASMYADLVARSGRSARGRRLVRATAAAHARARAARRARIATTTRRVIDRRRPGRAGRGRSRGAGSRWCPRR